MAESGENGAQRRPAFVITIEFDPVAGGVNFKASTGDAVIVLGMLEGAKAAFLQAQQAERRSPILVPPPGLRVE